MAMKLQLLLLLVLTVFFFNDYLVAQKEEQEMSISREEVPKNALDFIEDQGLKGKVKWYRETTSGKDSYESKFKREGKYYSVEFDTLGKIEDIEIAVRLRDLPKETRTIIKNSLSTEFKKFKWLKIQEQYTGTLEEMEKLFTRETAKLTLLYEVEVEGKLKDGGWEMFELLISPKGEIIAKRKITLRPTDNLNY
ncbi:MAG: hypothetical protein R3277_03750 [Brumimicrobium sp.]|nr:hypothetical protein [Brumimicrobium sp.]